MKLEVNISIFNTNNIRYKVHYNVSYHLGRENKEDRK